ncbi:hypothetical protein [Anaerotignum sp.]|nr:hypothetical protein [Anaerotignum sp.]
MKNMVVSLLAILCLSLSLAGCGETKVNTQNQDQQTPPANYTGEIKG